MKDFLLGVNYWALRAGMRMWIDWREDVVEADLRQIHAAGLRALRGFFRFGRISSRSPKRLLKSGADVCG